MSRQRLSVVFTWLREIVTALAGVCFPACACRLWQLPLHFASLNHLHSKIFLSVLSALILIWPFTLQTTLSRHQWSSPSPIFRIQTACHQTLANGAQVGMPNDQQRMIPQLCSRANGGGTLTQILFVALILGSLVQGGSSDATVASMIRHTSLRV